MSDVHPPRSVRLAAAVRHRRSRREQVDRERDGRPVVVTKHAIRDAGTAVPCAIAGALIPVSDLDRSIAFYRDTLGFEGSPTPTGYRLVAESGSAIYLLPSTDYPGQARWPLVTFETDDLEDFVADLQRRGVSLLTDVPFELHSDGIAAVSGCC